MHDLWRIEAVCQTIHYRWPDGALNLEPAHPICVPEYRALRILAMAKGGVRLLLRIAERQRVRWQIDENQSERTGHVEHIGEEIDDPWVLVNDGRSYTWVRLDCITYSAKQATGPSRESGLGCESPPRSHRSRKGKIQRGRGKEVHHEKESIQKESSGFRNASERCA